MRIIRKPRLGLAAVMCTPFRGDKEGNYSHQQGELLALASRLDFEIKIIPKGIYSTEDAEQAARELYDWRADFILLQAASFASGDFITPFSRLPSRLGLWAIPEGPPTSEGGLPLNSFTTMNLFNSLLRTRLKDHPGPVKWFWGQPGQPLFDERLEITIQSLRGVINLVGARIGLIGGVAPSFDNLIVDEEELKRRLGITVHHFEFNELLDMIRSVDDEHARVAAAEIRATAASFDETMGKALDISGRTDLAITRLAEENSLDACAISCWPRFQADLQFAVCTVMGHLNSHGLIASCEGDVTSAVSMLMLHSMTNGGTVTLMDLVTIDPADDSILLWHCGPTSPLLADERGARLESLWLFDGPQNNRVGLHNDLVLKPGKASVMGFSTDFQSMLILGGKIDNQKPGYSGSRGWLRDLQLNGTPVGTTDLVQTLMVSGYQHHYPLVYPDITAVGLETCQWLGVEPIAIEPYTPYVK